MAPDGVREKSCHSHDDDIDIAGYTLRSACHELALRPRRPRTHQEKFICREFLA